jgi:hypothetical protein
MKEEGTKEVVIYLKDIHSYYSFLDWIKYNFDEKIESRKDLPTLMLILLKKITDDASKKMNFEEKKVFKEEADKLKKRIRSHYVKKNK